MITGTSASGVGASSAGVLPGASAGPAPASGQSFDDVFRQLSGGGLLETNLDHGEPALEGAANGVDGAGSDDGADGAESGARLRGIVAADAAAMDAEARAAAMGPMGAMGALTVPVPFVLPFVPDPPPPDRSGGLAIVQGGQAARSVRAAVVATPAALVATDAGVVATPADVPAPAAMPPAPAAAPAPTAALVARGRGVAAAAGDATEGLAVPTGETDMDRWLMTASGDGELRGTPADDGDAVPYDDRPAGARRRVDRVGAVESRAMDPARAVESRAMDGEGALESRAMDRAGAPESRAVDRAGAVESRAMNGTGALESRMDRAGALESRTMDRAGALASRTMDLAGAVQSRAVDHAGVGEPPVVDGVTGARLREFQPGPPALEGARPVETDGAPSPARPEHVASTPDGRATATELRAVAPRLLGEPARDSSRAIGLPRGVARQVEADSTKVTLSQVPVDVALAALAGAMPETTGQAVSFEQPIPVARALRGLGATMATALRAFQQAGAPVSDAGAIETPAEAATSSVPTVAALAAAAVETVLPAVEPDRRALMMPPVLAPVSGGDLRVTSDTGVGARLWSASLPMLSHADGESVHSQIVQSLRVQWMGGAGEARVKLRPEYLGEVVATIRVDQGMVTATLQADTAEVRRWMEANTQALRDALGEHGLKLDRLAVVAESARGETSEDRQGRPRGRSPQNPQPRPRRSRQDDANATFELNT